MERRGQDADQLSKGSKLTGTMENKAIGFLLKGHAAQVFK